LVFFRNREECISLFISVREICQRRKFQGKFTYLAFLDLKKAYDSVPIFNILTKLYHYGVRGRCFDFLCNLYTSSKARARFASMLSNEFPIKRGVRQGCPLSPNTQVLKRYLYKLDHFITSLKYL